MENEIEFTSEMTTRYIVIIKCVETRMEDYFGCDDYQTAKGAYDLAKKSYKKLEWVALVGRQREANSPAIKYHVRLFDDRRPKVQNKIGGLGGLVNSLQSDWF